MRPPADEPAYGQAGQDGPVANATDGANAAFAEAESVPAETGTFAEPVASLAERPAELTEAVTDVTEPVAAFAASMAELSEPVAQLVEPLAETFEPAAAESTAERSEATPEICEPVAQLAESAAAPLEAAQIVESAVQLAESDASLAAVTADFVENGGQAESSLELIENLAETSELADAAASYADDEFAAAATSDIEGAPAEACASSPDDSPDSEPAADSALAADASHGTDAEPSAAIDQAGQADEPEVAALPATDLRLTGELTVHRADEIRATLLEALPAERPTALHVDLSEATEIDTAGLQLLMAAHLEARRHGGSFGIVAASGSVEQTLALFRQTHLLKPRDVTSAPA